ncbi:MAG: aldehyde ferredoxin oxidoreductase family protein [Candidatus Heimdallarchaeaceae archaeon]
MSGYRNIILRVNLTTKEIIKEQLNMKAAIDFIGGSGLAAFYFLSIIKDKIPEPLSPENPLIYMTGPLTGLPTTCSGRFSICSRSPLTGLWGESNSGGYFGPELKFAGYDGIIIEGIAEEPVILVIEDEQVQMLNASEYWGVGVFETQKRVLYNLKGENLVRYASIMNDGGRAAGRTGLGAVMGSKKLKAIAVRGTNRSFALSPLFKEKAKEARDVLKDDFFTELISELGSAGYIDTAVDFYGDMPIRNWSESSFEGSYDISGASMAETILVRRKACFQCPIGCGRVVEIPEGKYKLPKTDGPEYETLGAFGCNLKISDLKALAYANFKANDYGIDTISAGATIGFFLDLISKKIIEKKDLSDKIPLEFGNPETLLKLLELIAYRKGLGELLSDGMKALGERYNALELAPQIAGLEAPFHDPRAFVGTAILYLTSPRGACHNNGDAWLVQQGLSFPDLGIDDLPENRFENKGIMKQMVRLQSYRQLYNAMTICQYYNPPAKIIADLLGLAIEKELQPRDLISIGDRIFALKRLMNTRLGWKPELEKMPEIMLNRLDGPTEGNIPDYKLQLEEWYKLRNYSSKTGKPKYELLEKLGLLEYKEVQVAI